MSDIEHARMLFAMAERNVRALRGMMVSEIFSDEIFGFHAQQATEKLLKCWLSLDGFVYPRSHDLEHLIRLLVEHGSLVPDCFYALIDLNDFSVQFRYEIFDEEAIDRAAILKDVERCSSHLAARLAGAT